MQICCVFISNSKFFQILKIMATTILEIIQKGSITYGHLDGFIYKGSFSKGDVKYWKCRDAPQCGARLTTVNTGRNLLIRKGGSAKSHNHGPNPEAVESLRIMSNVKVTILFECLQHYIEIYGTTASGTKPS